MIVLCERDTDAVSAARKAGIDRATFAADELPRDRFLLREIARVRLEHKVAVVDRFRSLSHAVETHVDALRVRARREHEIVFELALLAVVDDVDAGIDVAVAHFAETRHAGAPRGRIVAREIVRHGRRRVFADDCSGMSGAVEAQANCGRWLRGIRLQRDDGFARRQEQRLAGAARGVANRSIELAAIFLESEWHGREVSPHIGGGCSGAVDCAVTGTLDARCPAVAVRTPATHWPELGGCTARSATARTSIRIRR